MNDSEKLILERIKNLRNQKGFSQSKIAQVIGISQTGYAKMERGDTDNLPLSVAVGIAKALNVGFNELFDIDGDSQKINLLGETIEDQKQKIEELKDQITLLKNEKEHIIIWCSLCFIDLLLNGYNKKKKTEGLMNINRSAN